MKPKVVIITNNYAPYRVPVYNWLAAEGGFRQFEVWWCGEENANRYWNTDYGDIKFSFKSLKHLKIFGYNHNFQMWHELTAHGPDIVVLTGYSRPKDHIALSWAKVNKRKVVLWYGCHHKKFQKKGIINKKIKSNFLRQCHTFVTYGSYAAEVLKDFGIPSRKIIKGCNIGNTNVFRHHMMCALGDGKERHSEYVRILCVAQLTKRKGISLLIKSLDLLRDAKWKLTIVGEGDERSRLVGLTHKHGLQDDIRFVGYKQRNELLNYYAEADIFVLPTLSDPFSIVSSEAIASGLFTILSKYDLASVDLLREGQNGCTIDPQDIYETSAKIRRAMERARDSGFDRKAISDSIMEFSEEYYAKKIKEAIWL